MFKDQFNLAVFFVCANCETKTASARENLPSSQDEGEAGQKDAKEHGHVHTCVWLPDPISRPLRRQLPASGTRHEALCQGPAAQDAAGPLCACGFKVRPR